MDEKEFYIDKDGFRIHAKLAIPGGRTVEKMMQPGAARLPLVIVVHGLTGHMEERHIVAVTQAALRAGAAALRVELYGHGKTDGDFLNHNLLEWVGELLYIIDYARSLPFAGSLYLTGHSQGGLAVMLAAALKEDQLRAIIPLSPAIMIRDACRKGEVFAEKFDPEFIPDRVKITEGKYVTGNYVRTGRVLPVEQAIDGFRKPVLIIHGTEDETVPYGYAEDAVRRYCNARLVPVPGDDHCYDRHLEVVTDAVTAFLREMEAGAQPSRECAVGRDDRSMS